MSDEKDTANVISMAKHTNSAKHTSVVEMLKQAIDDIEKGVDGYHPNKAVLLLLDDKDGGYVDGFYNAGMRTSEMVGLTKIMSDRFSLSMAGLIEF
ncbi:hypothetical protein [uncultured Thiothrix sp.]|uniref:hypothetical protein n=1 Tax=uncultured Thiothrix sp. TaxID=223185 RepID=UPI00261CF24C|nr:hypothetical protein [uncultured Thiothrix sp.]